MTIQMNGKTAIRDLMGRYPTTRAVIERHGIDCCCGGVKCLAEAAREHDLKLPDLVEALEEALETLVKLREVTHDYTIPAGDCPTFNAMYEELHRMEADLHEHIHLENNVLFSRAIALEAR